MKKIILAIAIVLLVGGGWLVINSNTVSYVAVVEDEVVELEAELEALEFALASGEITPEAALVAKAKIVARMNAINDAVKAADDGSLSASQRSQLLSGLSRLKNALGNYATTLEALDVVADQADEATKARHRSGAKKISTVITDTIAVVEEQAEEVIEDYEADPVVTDGTESEGEVGTETEVAEDDTEAEVTAGDTESTTDTDSDSETDESPSTDAEVSTDTDVTTDSESAEGDTETDSTTTATTTVSN